MSPPENRLTVVEDIAIRDGSLKTLLLGMANGKSETLGENETNLFSASPRLS